VQKPQKKQLDCRVERRRADEARIFAARTLGYRNGSNKALGRCAITARASVKSLQVFELCTLRSRERVLREGLQADKRFLYTAASGCLVKPLNLSPLVREIPDSTTTNRLYQKIDAPSQFNPQISGKE
jgi:hypothetical protein